MSMKDKDLPEFPIKTIPSSIKEMKARHFVVGEFPDNRYVYELFWMMLEEPECDFFYFGEQGKPVDPSMEEAKGKGDLLITETQFYWYRHPKPVNDKDFVHIERPTGKYEFEWERDVVEKGPMFMRMELKLSNKKKTELEIWKKIQIEEHFKEQMRKQKGSYDVFLSYNGNEATLAEEIFKKIIDAGGKAFLAKKTIEPGSDFAEEIRNALRESNELWLLVSPNSVKSEWVISEWGAAWVLEKRIVPILYRCSPESLPDRLRQLQCIDFHEYENLIKDKFSKSSKKSNG